jgi:hypothetical protein
MPMKKFVTVLITVLAISGIFGVNDAFSQTGEVDRVLIQYFHALRTGNLQTLSALLSDELLQRRGKSLANPRYSEFLKNLYGHAIFKVIHTTQLNSNQVSVDIEVTAENQTQIKETITFIKEQGGWKLQKDRKN